MMLERWDRTIDEQCGRMWPDHSSSWCEMRLMNFYSGASVGVIDAVVSVDELIKGIQQEVKEVVARITANI